jgi:hypothetical protein
MSRLSWPRGANGEQRHQLFDDWSGRAARDRQRRPDGPHVFGSPSRDAFSGLALAIVRGNGSQSGAVTLTATSQGLSQGTVMLTAE